jgi:hypothetical protein
MARHPGTSAGLALGLLYLVEAVFNTGLLFAVWPILGGIFAAALVKWNPGTDLTAGSGARAGAKAGLVGGLVLLVAGTPLTLYLMRKLGEEPGFFGITFDMGPILTLLTIFSIYVLFGILVAAAYRGAYRHAGRARGIEDRPRCASLTSRPGRQQTPRLWRKRKGRALPDPPFLFRKPPACGGCRLALGELEGAAGLGAAVLLALHDAGSRVRKPACLTAVRSAGSKRDSAWAMPCFTAPA